MLAKEAKMKEITKMSKNDLINELVALDKDAACLYEAWMPAKLRIELRQMYAKLIPAHFLLEEDDDAPVETPAVPIPVRRAIKFSNMRTLPPVIVCCCVCRRRRQIPRSRVLKFVSCDDCQSECAKCDESCLCSPLPTKANVSEQLMNAWLQDNPVPPRVTVPPAVRKTCEAGADDILIHAYPSMDQPERVTFWNRVSVYELV
jgi:hypothetical protein